MLAQNSRDSTLINLFGGALDFGDDDSDPADLPLAEVYPFLFDHLFRAVGRILDDHGFSPTHGEMQSAYTRFVCVQQAKELHLDMIVPLLGFTSEIPSVTLGSIEIRPLLAEDKNRIYRDLRILDTEELAEATFAMYAEFSEPANYSPWNKFLDDETRLAITALRLGKSGDVGATTMYCCPRGDWLHAGPSAIHLQYQRRYTSHPWRCNTGKTYALHEGDVTELLGLFDWLHKCSDRLDGLAVALGRFHQMYARASGEDRIIDLSIALESCLLTGVKEELKYRLSLRGAVLLARTHTPKYVQLLLQTMYDVRSQIVHSGAPMHHRSVAKLTRKVGCGSDYNRFVDECENIVRSILRQYVAHMADGKTVEAINNSLDDRIAKSLS